MNKVELGNISKRLVASRNIEEEIESAKLLSDFFSSFDLSEDKMTLAQKKSETVLSGGIALSPAEAGICVNDYIRTARFIKATYLAIEQLKQKFHDQKIEILYAGCGPYATILLPLLPLLNKEYIHITLLDINEYSLVSVKKLLRELELYNYDIDLLHTDAINYQHPVSQPLHLVITETMFHALTREPQVAVTANLAPQITEDGILIPEEIKLSMAYSFFSEEPFLQNGDTAFTGLKTTPVPYIHRSESNTLFSMNKHDNFSDKAGHHSFQFESSLYELPEEFSKHPDICIYTDIRIFHHLTLGLAESYITNPYCVNSIYNLSDHMRFKLIYSFKDTPKWEYEKGDKL